MRQPDPVTAVLDTIRRYRRLPEFEAVDREWLEMGFPDAWPVAVESQTDREAIVRFSSPLGPEVSMRWLTRQRREGSGWVADERPMADATSFPLLN